MFLSLAMNWEAKKKKKEKRKKEMELFSFDHSTNHVSTVS